MKKMVSLFLCIVIIFSLCACGSSQNKKVVGTWSGEFVYENGRHLIRKLQIYEDGTVEKTDYYNPQYYRNTKEGEKYTGADGTWEISSGIMKLTLSAFATYYERYQLDLENNKMSLVNGDYDAVLIKQN